MSTTNRPDPSPDPAGTFESELDALERLIARLEAGGLPLAEELKLYEEGVQRLRKAEGLLGEAEAKLAQLTPRADGTVEERPLSDPEDPDAEEEP